jgi:hypothetical protein
MSNWLWGITVCSTIAWALFDAIRKRLVILVPIGALSFWVSVAQDWTPALASVLVQT